MSIHAAAVLQSPPPPANPAFAGLRWSELGERADLHRTRPAATAPAGRAEVAEPLPQEVRERFNETLLLARRCIAWGPTADVLQAEPLQLAQRTAQAWDDDASVWRQVA